MEGLLNWYRNYFNLGNALFTHIQHEDATVALVYKITSCDSTYVLKICACFQDYQREKYFLTYFANTLSVPRIKGWAILKMP